MKKIFKTTMAFVAAVSLLSLAGCAKVQKEDINPTYDGEVVKTTFSIALPSQSQLKSRMSADIVQEGAAADITKFRGMDQIVIIPYNVPVDRTTRHGNSITLGLNKIVKPATTAGNNAENAIPSGKLLDNSNAVVYNDVAIPIGTKAFLFYGRATEASVDSFENGALNVVALFDNTKQTTDFFFEPARIIKDANFDKSKGDALAAYVTAIAKAQHNADSTWAKSADPSDPKMGAYSLTLGDHYTNFTSMKAGASAYIQAAVQDLYTTLLSGTDVISMAIKDSILLKATDDGTGKLTFDASISGYPGNNNYMPDGTVSLNWSAGTASAVNNLGYDVPDTSSTPVYSYSQRVDKIVYPASLYYFANSQIKTSNTSRVNDYDGIKKWFEILNEYEIAKGEAVTVTTRSVAICDSINYAVGRLDTKVKQLIQPKYYDRKGEEVYVTDGFTLTGVLIGGQKKVDWKFEPYGDDEYTIYDKEIAGTTTLTTTADAGTNYTLALETAADTPVFVVLELQNNGTDARDFQGVDGVVKKGCKFYMVAKLDPASAGASNGDKTGNRVFQKDHHTIVNFTIGAGSADSDNNGVADTPAGFANAYVTIPDLRTPKLELGFSVDLTWEEGMTFEYTF